MLNQNSAPRLQSPIESSMRPPSTEPKKISSIGYTRCGPQEILARISNVKTLFVVADVQGNTEPTRALLERAQIINRAGEWVASPGTVLIFLGDLIDGGPDGRGALELVLRLTREASAKGGVCDLVLGNHECWMIDALTNPPGSGFLEAWLRNGALPTLESFGLNPQRQSPKEFIAAPQVQATLKPFVDWLISRPHAALVNDKTLLVHAAPDLRATTFDKFGADTSDPTRVNHQALVRLREDRSWLPTESSLNRGLDPLRQHAGHESISHTLRLIRQSYSSAEVQTTVILNVHQQFQLAAALKFDSNKERYHAVSALIDRLQLGRIFFGHSAQLHAKYYGPSGESCLQGYPYQPFPTLPVYGLNVLPRAADPQFGVQVGARLCFDDQLEETSCELMVGHRAPASTFVEPDVLCDAQLPPALRYHAQIPASVTPISQTSHQRFIHHGISGVELAVYHDGVRRHLPMTIHEPSQRDDIAVEGSRVRRSNIPNPQRYPSRTPPPAWRLVAIGETVHWERDDPKKSPAGETVLRVTRNGATGVEVELVARDFHVVVRALQPLIGARVRVLRW